MLTVNVVGCTILKSKIPKVIFYDQQQVLIRATVGA